MMYLYELKQIIDWSLFPEKARFEGLQLIMNITLKHRVSQYLSE